MKVPGSQKYHSSINVLDTISARFVSVSVVKETDETWLEEQRLILAHNLSLQSITAGNQDDRNLK